MPFLIQYLRNLTAGLALIKNRWWWFLWPIHDWGGIHFSRSMIVEMKFTLIFCIANPKPEVCVLQPGNYGCGALRLDSFPWTLQQFIGMLAHMHSNSAFSSGILDFDDFLQLSLNFPSTILKFVQHFLGRGVYFRKTQFVWSKMCKAIAKPSSINAFFLCHRSSIEQRKTLPLDNLMDKVNIFKWPFLRNIPLSGFQMSEILGNGQNHVARTHFPE